MLWKEILGIGEVSVLRLIVLLLHRHEHELTRRRLDLEVEGMLRIQILWSRVESLKKCSERKKLYCRV